MENTNLTVVNSLLKALRTVCEDNGLNYVLAVEAKNKPDSDCRLFVQMNNPLV